MRSTWSLPKFLLAVLLVLISHQTISDQAYPELDQKFKQILADIDKRGDDKFNPCKTETNKHNASCKAGEYVLWTAYKVPLEKGDKLRDLKKDLQDGQVIVNHTPAGIYAEKALNALREEMGDRISDKEFWDSTVVVWQPLSRAYVSNLLRTQSKVTIYIGDSRDQPRPESVFCEIELPTILSTKPEQVVLIATGLAKYKDYDGKRITKRDQFPCGTQNPVAWVEPEEKPDGKKSYADGQDHFDKSVAKKSLKDPVRAWKTILASISTSPIVAKLVAAEIKHLEENQFSFHTNLNVAGKALKYSGSMLLNPDAKNNELFAKFEASLHSGNLQLGALKASDPKLELVVVNEAGKKQLYARISPHLKLKGQSLPAVMNISSVGTDKHISYNVDFRKAVSLVDFLPSSSDLSVLKGAAINNMQILPDQYHVATSVHNKKVSVTVGFKKQAEFKVESDDLKVSDIVPEAGKLKALNGVSLSLVSVNRQQFEVDGKLAGKNISFVKRRKSKGAVEIKVDDMTVSTIFPSLAKVPALNAIAIEKIDLNPDFVEVEVLLNGERIDLVRHLGKADKHNYIAIYFDKLHSATFIPAAKGHLVDELELDKALFLLQPDGSEVLTVAPGDLPGELSKLVDFGKDNKFQIKPGLNISSQLNVARAPRLSAVFKQVGLKSGRLPLDGTLSLATFKMLAGKGKPLSGADKTAILNGLALNIDLPVPSLPTLSNLVKISGPVKLSIGGVAQNDFWTRLPKSMSTHIPKDHLGVTLQFGTQLTGASINEKLDALIDVGTGDSKSLSLLMLSQGQWKQPFGIKALTLKSGGFQFGLQSKKGNKQAELAFFGAADLGQHKDIDVTADFSRAKGKLKLKYFALDGKFSLHDFPGVGSIPHAERFELDEIKIAASGIEARTVLAGKKVNAFVFEMSSDNWVFAIDQKNFKFAELLPAIKKVTPLNKITLPRVALILSKNGIVGNYQNMPEIAKDLLSDIFGKSAVNINVPSGVGLLAGFDEKHMGAVGKGLKKLGVHDDAILMGGITGIFNGTPGIQIGLAMEQAGSTHGLPRKVMSIPRGVTPEFFINWSGTEFFVGAGLGLNVKVGKDTLHLESKIELEFNAEGVGIDILGEMDGTWNKPFGIKGISLSDVTMEAGINDVGEVSIGFKGTDKIGNEVVHLGTKMKILLEAGIPDAVAFTGTMSNLGVPALIEITEDLMGIKGKLDKSKMPFFEIHDALLAFGTPGTADPQLGLTGTGFAAKGKFFFMQKHLGNVTALANLTNGITLSGEIDNFDLDVVKFQNNNIDMAINLKPKFILNSNIALLGAKQVVKVDLSPPHFEFDITEQLGVFGEADLHVVLDGFDLTRGTYLRNSDISVVGGFKSTLVPWMEKEIAQGVTELRQSAKARLAANRKALKSAQAKVDNLNKQIQKLRAEDNRSKSRSQDRINQAEKRVTQLKGKYQHALYESKHCGTHWTHWACAGYWEVEAGSIYSVYKVTEDTLEAIKSAESAAFDLDPRIAALLAERDLAMSALSIAQGVITTAENAEDFVLKNLEKTLESRLKHLPFELDQAIIVGDLRDMIKKKAPLVLDMKFKMFGSPMREYFAIKINDPGFNAVSFALLPALAMDRMTEKVLSKVNPTIAQWVHSHIALKLVKAEAAVRKAVEAEEKKFANVLKSFDTGGKKFETAYQKLSSQRASIVSQTQVSDLFGNSKTYKSTYLAVGHSTLCLGVAANGTDVIQENCKDIEADRWHTKSIADGYVLLLNKGSCLKARNKSVVQDNPLLLASCNGEDLHEQWKVVSTDGFYDKIINRHSQKCLHFDRENANPKTAQAVWTSCMGADSQTFRDIKDAERPTWHNIKSMLKARNGSCLSLKGGHQSQAQTMLLSRHVLQGKLSRAQYKHLQHAGDDVLYAESCDREQDVFNYIEQVNGDIKLVHAISGWCVHPKTERGRQLVLAPCDRGKDMLWRLNRARGNAWVLKNVYTSRCLVLPDIQKNSRAHNQAFLANCVKNNSQTFDFQK